MMIIIYNGDQPHVSRAPMPDKKKKESRAGPAVWRIHVQTIGQADVRKRQKN